MTTLGAALTLYPSLAELLSDPVFWAFMAACILLALAWSKIK